MIVLGVLGVVLLVAFALRRAASGRADPAAHALPEPELHGHERSRLHRRLRAVRCGHLPAAVPADRQGPQPDRVRSPAHADDGRRARDLDRERAADQPRSAATAVPDRRDRADDARRCSCSRGSASTMPVWQTAIYMLVLGLRPRNDDAGARARRAELRRLRAARRRDLGLDALPPGRRLGGRLDLRRDLRQPARHERRKRAAAGRPAAAGREPELVEELPPAVHRPTSSAFVESLRPVFAAAAGVSLFAFLLTLAAARGAAAQERRGRRRRRELRDAT